VTAITERGATMQTSDEMRELIRPARRAVTQVSHKGGQSARAHQPQQAHTRYSTDYVPRRTLAPSRNYRCARYVEALWQSSAYMREGETPSPRVAYDRDMTSSRMVAVRGAALIPLGLATLLACAPIYGASFGYPDDPPTPDSASSVLSDEGWDDDDPIRTRVRVVDSGAGDQQGAALLDFYRETFGPQDGWTEEDPTGEQVLCLVNQSDERFTQVIDVFPYAGSRVDVRPGRYLVMNSRIEEPDTDDACGIATSWIPSDLHDANLFE
jgi:hypothetical protein